jgi:hypothetical protein
MDFIAHQKGVRWIQIEGNSHNKYKIDEEGFEVEFKSSFCSMLIFLFYFKKCSTSGRS